MAHLTPAERRAFPYSDHMPADVLQRLSRAELADRLLYSRELGRRIKKSAQPAQQRSITQELIAMMRAGPRSSTERDVAQRIAKAASVPDASQGSALRREAQQLLNAQPPAPRRRDAELIVKAVAGEDGLMPIYDGDGVLVGVCQESALTRIDVSKGRAGTPVKRAPRPVAKAIPPDHVVLYDKSGNTIGWARPEDIEDPGPVKAGGTTGLGLPRNAPQRALPGDVADRQVVKSKAAAAAEQRDAALRDYARQLSAAQTRSGQ